MPPTAPPPARELDLRCTCEDEPAPDEWCPACVSCAVCGHPAELIGLLNGGRECATCTAP
ncbi:hypothetical protein GCM10022221_68070 [Actinocorallia aurea]